MTDDRKAQPPTSTDAQTKPQPQVLPDWIVEHLREYGANPEKAHLMDTSALGGPTQTPTLLLTTRGRKTGRMLTMPLIYGKDGDDYVIVGSKGGAAQNPGWMFNLEADPNVGVQVVRDRFDAVARITTGAERARLWDMMVGVYPPYTKYQLRTPREIPVVVLSRK